MQGYILDHRKEIESDVWLLPPMYHRVWQWLKYKVNHAEAKIPNRDGTFTTIKPGQHATSYRLIAKGVGYYDGLKWKEPNPKTVKVILDWLEKQNMITVKGNTNGTVVTVVNWETYQTNSVKGNAKETLKKHQLDTNNNDISNNLNNELLKPFVPKFPLDGEVRRLTDLLIDRIKRNNEYAKVPQTDKAIDKWCVHVDRMMRLDKIDAQLIANVIDWCQKDSFWSSNILSTDKLRKQFPKLYGKYTGGGNGGQTRKGPDYSAEPEGYEGIGG